jgi:DNA-directed RNA polymerase subunit RPC12/RpoP
MTIRTVKACLTCGKEAIVNKTEKKPYCSDCAFKNLMKKLGVK